MNWNPYQAVVRTGLARASFEMSAQLARAYYRVDRRFTYLESLGFEAVPRWRRVLWWAQAWLHAPFCCGGCEGEE